MLGAALISVAGAAGAADPRGPRARGLPGRLPARRAFTLIELMIVIGIMAIVLGIGVPITYKVRNRDPLNQAVRDVMEVISNARARAILQGTMSELVLHPKEKRIEVSGGAPTSAKPENAFTPAEPDKPSAPPDTDSGLVAVLSNRVTVEMMDVNLIEYKDAESARVRFYPNGTCDEFTLILRSDKGEFIKVWLEITTGLPNVGPVDR